jgi:chaperonin GroEL (HSP60 family)
LLSEELNKFSNQFKGREQLAVRGFGECLEVIHESIAKNAGLDPIDLLAEMRSSIGKIGFPGIDVENNRVVDSIEMGVVEPLDVKLRALRSAVEVASMILRIDDVINVFRNPKEAPKVNSD